MTQTAVAKAPSTAPATNSSQTAPVNGALPEADRGAALDSMRAFRPAPAVDPKTQMVTLDQAMKNFAAEKGKILPNGGVPTGAQLEQLITAAAKEFGRTQLTIPAKEFHAKLQNEAPEVKTVALYAAATQGTVEEKVAFATMVLSDARKLVATENPFDPKFDTNPQIKRLLGESAAKGYNPKHAENGAFLLVGGADAAKPNGVIKQDKLGQMFDTAHQDLLRFPSTVKTPQVVIPVPPLPSGVPQTVPVQPQQTIPVVPVPPPAGAPQTIPVVPVPPPAGAGAPIVTIPTPVQSAELQKQHIADLNTALLKERSGGMQVQSKRREAILNATYATESVGAVGHQGAFEAAKGAKLEQNEVALLAVATRCRAEGMTKEQTKSYLDTVAEQARFEDKKSAPSKSGPRIALPGLGIPGLGRGGIQAPSFDISTDTDQRGKISPAERPKFEADVLFVRGRGKEYPGANPQNN